MKILNLYAGVGGNRALWQGHEIVAVENNPKIATVYEGLFPNDVVVVGDAHQYLLDHFKEFDFIWSSPPCPTHSVTNHFLHAQGVIRYPDMSLWQEIVFLQKWYKGKFVVENVKSYYKPLVEPIEIDRHYFWSNFQITPFEVKREFNIANARASTGNKNDIKSLEEFHGIFLGDIPNKRLLLRNCVYPPLGQHILDNALSV